MRLLEFGIEGFTVNYFRLMLLFMEHRVIKWVTFVENGNLARGVFTYSDLRLAHGVTRARGLDLINHLVVLQGEVFGQRALLLPGEDQIEILTGQ